MELEDSKNALFADPNAYIQRVKDQKQTKKIVFSEPYENVPNYYINNGFKKGQCDCVKTPKKDCECNKKDDKKSNCKNSFLSGLNIQSLMPLITMFSGGKGVDITKILSTFSAQNNGNNSLNTNPLLNAFSRPDLLKNISQIFVNKNQKTEDNQSKPKSTDCVINNFSRVE